MGFLAQLNGVDFGSLDLLARVLLISDGTLTDIIEAAFLEPVALVKVGTGTFAAPARLDELGLEAGANVMRRRIVLQGETSGTAYVHAESLIALDALPPRFREDLVESAHPLGRLWVLHKLETRKEILKVWRRPAGDLAERFGVEPSAGFLARAYRVVSRGRPMMLITESFPAGLRPPPGNQLP